MRLRIVLRLRIFTGFGVERIDELQLTSSFSRQKHWTAKRASFFQSVHALNMKRCGVCGGRDERVLGVSVEKCGGGVGKCVGVWEEVGSV